jgi:methionyl-tRNA formyltransferase
VPSWAIYNGEREHGVTLHWMAAEVDAGHIAYSAEMPISERDTGLTLSTACVRDGLPLVERLLADADEGNIPTIRQDLAQRNWYGPKGPHGGRMPWTLPARQAVDLVRASDYGPFPSPWGRPRTPRRAPSASATGMPSTWLPATNGCWWSGFATRTASPRQASAWFRAPS